jgi:hypothetical protein
VSHPAAAHLAFAVLQVFLVPEAQLSPGEQEWGRIESSSTRLIATVVDGQCIRSSAHAIGRCRPCLWIGPRRQEAKCLPQGLIQAWSMDHLKIPVTRCSVANILGACACRYYIVRSPTHETVHASSARTGLSPHRPVRVVSSAWECYNRAVRCRRGLILSDRRLGSCRVHKCVGGGTRAKGPATLGPRLRLGGVVSNLPVRLNGGQANEDRVLPRPSRLYGAVIEFSAREGERSDES